jgi:hypothetical protein
MPVVGVLTVGAALAIVRLDPHHVAMAAAIGPWLAAVLLAQYRSFVHPHLTVDEVGVTVVNRATTFQIPWDAIEKVELEPMQPGKVAMSVRRYCRLAFTTPGKLVRAEAPVGFALPTGRMAALKNRILEYRDHAPLPVQTQSPTRPKVAGYADGADPEHPATVVEVPGAIRRYLNRHSKTAKIYYVVGLAVGIAYFVLVIVVTLPAG